MWIDFGLLPNLTFAAIPGAMNFLQFLQKLELTSNGILILNFILIFFAIWACLSANPGLFLEKMNIYELRILAKELQIYGYSNENSLTLKRRILKKLSQTINFLKPKNVIPFASFCFFSRDDNFYLNDSINKKLLFGIQEKL